ncbi:MAG: hypothetical protein KKG75_01520 [Nanoarchaeota archaeon]|nr:hypothetical protein [Nanoarchaeota archaeon]
MLEQDFVYLQIPRRIHKRIAPGSIKQNTHYQRALLQLLPNLGGDVTDEDLANIQIKELEKLLEIYL